MGSAILILFLSRTGNGDAEQNTIPTLRSDALFRISTPAIEPQDIHSLVVSSGLQGLGYDVLAEMSGDEHTVSTRCVWVVIDRLHL